ncbi:MAG: hypothetical protein PVF43_03340 [Candidatus Eiseniibacteriota bacterium]|jgi:hypothetical protein
MLHLLAIVTLPVAAAGGAAAARPDAVRLAGVIRDAESGATIAGVRITAASRRTHAASDGTFVLRVPPPRSGSIDLELSHVAYAPRTVAVALGAGDLESLVIELTPRARTLEPIVVTDEAIDPSLPVRAIPIARREIGDRAGNIANDPLRTVQADATAAPGGIDFNSGLSIRAADPDEHRVYLDGYPLDHSAHVGGFAEIVPGDFIERVDLIPGAAPLRYAGQLSGVIRLTPADVERDTYLFRYDITSMSGGLMRQLGPATTLLAAGKGSYFTLPVYQQIGVDQKSFWDVYARLRHRSTAGWSVATTVLAAHDTEDGDPVDGVTPRRVTSSWLVGTAWTLPRGAWTVRLRPSFNHLSLRDAVTVRDAARSHRLARLSIAGSVERELGPLRLVLAGDGGLERHRGRGPSDTSPALRLWAEGRWWFAKDQALVVGVGGSREPWTGRMAPEAYGSWTWTVPGRFRLAAGWRRSHQTPFRYTTRQSFASIPIDAGDLERAHVGGWRQADAVTMDQLSATVEVDLPATWGLALDGYTRRYRDLLVWNWNDDFTIENVRGVGDGAGRGYEIRLLRRPATGLAVELSLSRAAIEKREGTLPARRAGDHDRQTVWRLKLAYPLTPGLTLALGWQDLTGRPATVFGRITEPPPVELVNAERMPRYQRLDLKLSYRVTRGSSETHLFIDLVNLLNRSNLATRLAVQTAPGSYTSVPYGGVKLFPIVGVSARVW